MMPPMTEARFPRREKFCHFTAEYIAAARLRRFSFICARPLCHFRRLACRRRIRAGDAEACLRRRFILREGAATSSRYLPAALSSEVECFPRI